MATNNSSHFGHFLKFQMWEDALKLLNFQIAQKQKNKHYNTLNMFFFERLGNTVDCLNTEVYFQKKIASNLFYGLESEFSFLDYVVPKSGSFGLRNYKFFSYPMRALYNAVGVYLLNLSHEFLTEYVSARKHIKSYYGANLSLEGDRLKFSSNTIFYYNYYKSFRHAVRQELKADLTNKMVIRLDIQNYYDEIGIPILLEFLSTWIKPSTQAKMNYDTFTKEQIISFFRFLANGKSGIPQADNDIFSAFIGHLYLVFSDLLLDDLISSKNSVIDKYTVIRYVDDIYISITFKQGIYKVDRESYAESLASLIAETLFYKLALKLNPKSRLFWLDHDNDKENLLRNLKKVSPKYYIADDENDEAPQNKINNIFDELENLKRSSVDPYFNYERSLTEEILKEVFDKVVGQMLDKPENRERIREIFTDFNFDLVKARPLEIMIVLLKDPTATERFKDFLLRKPYLTTGDIDLIFTFLCQTEFANGDLLEKLKLNPYICGIIETFLKASLSNDFPGYYKLADLKCQTLSELTHIIEQIRLRILSERSGLYSVALNHLLNEIHAICRSHDSSPSKEYDANDVIKFLLSKNVPHTTAICIRNLFDRRNTNQVSHPGSDNQISWGVAPDEYSYYRSQVGECLEKIL